MALYANIQDWEKKLVAHRQSRKLDKAIAFKSTDHFIELLKDLSVQLPLVKQSQREVIEQALSFALLNIGDFERYLTRI